MKKIFVSLFACVLFLFSCNLNMSSGDTDLIVYLPGSEGKVTLYDEDDVESYRIDLTNANGDYYSETGERGGTIVFNNILCGTYTVDIWGLDENTFVAAHTRTTITVFKGEENYLSATAILGNKVSDFFVSVPEGVWNSDYKNCFREANYYNAVRDVYYACDDDGIIHAEIINPDVEYAYLNSLYGKYSVDDYGKMFKLPLGLKAERKTTFIITVLDSLCEEYGKTDYVNYDPNDPLNLDGYKNYTFIFPGRSLDSWKPLVRIGFTRDCGQVCIDATNNASLENGISSSWFDFACGIPLEKHAVEVKKDENKFIFRKSKSGDVPMAAIIPLEACNGDSVSYYFSKLKVNKNVKKFSICGKSFASKHNKFISEFKDFELEAGKEYNFSLLLPGCREYDSQWEGSYAEIYAEGYDGDELEMTIESIGSTHCQMGLSLISGLNNFSHFNSIRLYEKAQNNSFSFCLKSGESRVLGVSQYDQGLMIPDILNKSDYNYTDVVYSYETYYIPSLVTQIMNNCSNDITVKKIDNCQFYIQNNSSFDKKIDGIISGENILSLTDVAGNSYKFASFRNIESLDSYKRVKVSTIDLSSFWVRDGQCNEIMFSVLKGIPIIGKASEDPNKKILLSSKPEYGNAVYQYVIKTKKGDVIKEGVIENMDTSEKVTGHDIPFVNGYYKVALKYTYPGVDISLDKKYSKTDLIVEIYLRWDKDYLQNIDMITMHDFMVTPNLTNKD